MYESFGRLKGKKVCGKNNGKYFGRLSDIIVNKGTNMIIGIVSKNDSLIYRHRLFLKDDIEGSDEVHIYVKGSGERLLKSSQKNNEFQSIENDIFRRKAVFSDGLEAGRIQNINLNLESGTIVGFEIGTSIAQDLLTGRKMCRTRDTITICRGSIVLQDEDKKIFF